MPRRHKAKLPPQSSPAQVPLGEALADVMNRLEALRGEYEDKIAHIENMLEVLDGAMAEGITQ